VHDATVSLNALLEEMVARGQLDLRSFEERRQLIRQREIERDQKRHLVQVADKVDKYALAELPEIDCASLIPHCKARCCQLTFPLSFQDLDERVVEWDYSRPYQIRKKSDGYCVHSSKETHACQVYAQRPAVCRTYDCRRDKRIWRDFEKRLPAGDPQP
jgi:Fe-S-cluster containining protein